MKMNMKRKSFRMKYTNGSWAIQDRASLIHFDQALVDAYSVTPTYVEGYFVASHGFSAEFVEFLDSSQRRELGIVGSPNIRPQRGCKRIQLLPGGKIDSRPQQ